MEATDLTVLDDMTQIMTVALRFKTISVGKNYPHSKDDLWYSLDVVGHTYDAEFSAKLDQTWNYYFEEFEGIESKSPEFQQTIKEAMQLIGAGK